MAVYKIMIIESNGTLKFEDEYATIFKIEPHMLAAFLSALMHFSDELFVEPGKMNMIKIGELYIHFIRVDNHFVIMFDDEKESSAKRLIENTADILKQLYPPEKWASGFPEEVKENLSKTLKLMFVESIDSEKYFKLAKRLIEYLV